MEYIKVSEAAEKWGLSPRQVRKLCAEGKIAGLMRKGRMYMIPKSTPMPLGGREKRVCSLVEIEEKRQRLDATFPLTPRRARRLQNSFLLDFTYHSNALAGNTLTLNESAMALEGMSIDGKPLRDQLEAVGHMGACQYADELAQKDMPLSEFIIMCLHALTLADPQEEKGLFRSVPAHVAGACKQPLPPYLIQTRLAALLAKNEDRRCMMNDLKRIALFHLEFEEIHPFSDGNGRTGRLIMIFDLIRSGYPPVSIKVEDRKQYYDAFDSFSRDGSPDAMTALIARYMDERLDECLRIREA